MIQSRTVLAALLLTAIPLSASGKDAPAGINPECVRMGKNQRQCTCALETGGQIEPNGRWRYYNTPRYTACMQQKGWM